MARPWVYIGTALSGTVRLMILKKSVATDKNRISAYVSDALKEKAEALARREGRSLSSLLAYLLQEAVDQAEKEGRI